MLEVVYTWIWFDVSLEFLQLHIERVYTSLHAQILLVTVLLDEAIQEVLFETRFIELCWRCLLVDERRQR